MRKNRFMQKKEWRALLQLAAEQPSVCFFAPVFTPENEKDGYIRRIKAIDAALPGDLRRFYIMGDAPEGSAAELRHIDDTHYYIRFDSFSLPERLRAYRLMHRCGTLYTHSVYRFMAGRISPRMKAALFLPGVRHIWDVHGAVPEECRMNGDPGIAEVAEVYERLLYRRAGRIICVSRAMERHLRDKWGKTNAEFTLLPIFTPQKEHPAWKPRPEKPVILYSGGLQSWQMIPETQDLIAETMDRYSYRVFVPDPDAFLRMWGERAPLCGVTLGSRAPEEMDAEYDTCHYGLLLREDSAVNRVACPTKLIE